MPVAWNISRTLDAALINIMLDRTILSLTPNEHPVVHSDRGCHYRWPRWTKRMNRAGLTRSMSRKGCSPDNSACEGFFGRMKNEMFYGRSWQGVLLEEFIHEIEEYMLWYRDKRIKISLDGMSPMEYRTKMSKASPLWKTMERKGITQYQLLKNGIDNKTLNFLKKNKNITLNTLEGGVKLFL